MKFFALVVMAASLLLASAFPPADQEATPPRAAPAPQVNYSCEIPYDATFADSADFDRQEAFDIFSWNSFIALNWPADTSSEGAPPCNLKNGVARDCGKPLPRGDYGPTVWETYKSDAEVFRGDEKGAVEPIGWNCPLEPLPGCDSLDAKDAAEAGIPSLRMIIKDANQAHEFVQAGTMAPLIDQNGSFVRYEMRMNRDEFDFIDQRKLWDSNNFKGDVDFQPVGSNANKTVGPMEVKAAWKVLTDKDDRERFHARTVEIAWPNPDKKGKYLCKQYTMGLVGLHIGHKTQNAPQWVWSTFEHVDNYKGANPSFADPDCPESKCPPNVVPKAPEAGWNGDPRLRYSPPIQVAVLPGSAATIPHGSVTINDEVRQKLAGMGSVWQYYELVSTQWPSVPYINGKPAEVLDKATLINQGAGQIPHLLANTTMETYVMGPNEQINTSSCMACHNKARIGPKTDPETKKKKYFRADFSYLLQDAFPEAANKRSSQQRREEQTRAFHQDTSRGGRKTTAVRKTQ
jgi:hypothetical protein